MEHAYDVHGNTNNRGEIEAGISRETYSLSVSVDRKLNAVYNAYCECTYLNFKLDDDVFNCLHRCSCCRREAAVTNLKFGGGTARVRKRYQAWLVYLLEFLFRAYGLIEIVLFE